MVSTATSLLSHLCCPLRMGSPKTHANNPARNKNFEALQPILATTSPNRAPSGKSLSMNAAPLDARKLFIKYDISTLFRKNKILRTNRDINNTFGFLNRTDANTVTQRKGRLFRTLVKEYEFDPRVEMENLRKLYNLPNTSRWGKFRNRPIPVETINSVLADSQLQKIWCFLAEFKDRVARDITPCGSAYLMGRNLDIYRYMLTPSNYLTAKLNEIQQCGGVVYDLGAGRCNALVDLRSQILPVNDSRLKLHAVTLMTDLTQEISDRCEQHRITVDTLRGADNAYDFPEPADLIFDVYGQLTYDKHLSRDLAQLCNALKVGGEAYIITDAPATLICDSGKEKSFQQWFLGLVKEGVVKGIDILSIHQGENDVGKLVIRRTASDRIDIPPLTLKSYQFIADGAVLRGFEA